jgi:cell division protein FtsW
MTIGVVVIYSISPGLAAIRGVSENFYVSKQLLAAGLGIVTFITTALIPLSWWKKAVMPLLILALIGSIIALATPLNEVYQAHRWIRFSGLSFQVAELIKLVIVIWAAVFLTKQWQNGLLADFKSTMRPLLIAMGILLVTVAGLQSDLGSAGVMVIVITAMAYVAGVPIRRFLIVVCLLVLALTIFIASSSYRQDRFFTYLHPESDCSSAGYQACQALIAVGSGGLTGLGLGQSVQAYGYLPEASNDSIFAIMAEKFGFIGISVVIGLYGLLIARFKRIIEHSSDQFSRLVVVGVMAWISTQAIINVGAMVGLLPLKGITLPFISYGGTSMIFLTAAVGLVFQISRYTSYSEIEPKADIEPSANSTQNSTNGRGLRRSYNPNIVSRPRD